MAYARDRLGVDSTYAKAPQTVIQYADEQKKGKKGKKKGVYEGRVAVRKSGSFNIKQGKQKAVQGIGWKHCKIIQQIDGYSYKNRMGVDPPL